MHDAMTISGYKLRVTGLARAGADSVAEALDAMADLPDAVALDIEDEGRDLWTLEAYFSTTPDRAGLEAIVGTAGETSLEALPETDWVTAGLDQLGAIRAGRLTLHGHHQHARFAHHPFAIEVDAGTAFGTGHHGSTRGALMALDLGFRRRCFARVLDVGTGAGVLAIAAARLGARHVVATDIDAEAVRVAGANAAHNRTAPGGIAGRIEFIVADGAADRRLRPPVRYDLITANILARPLMALAGPLSRLMAPGGRLILSGLLAGQDRKAAAVYRARGLVIARRIVIDGWATLSLGTNRRCQSRGRP